LYLRFLDGLNIYTLLDISSLVRLKNNNKNNENKQYCGHFIDYSKEFG